MAVGLTVGCARPQTVKPDASEPEEGTHGSSGEMLSRVYRHLVHREPEEALALLQEHEKAHPCRDRSERAELTLVALCAAGREKDAIGKAAEIGAEAAKAAQAERARRQAERARTQAQRDPAEGDRPKTADPFGFGLFLRRDLLEHNDIEDCGRRVEAEHERQFRWDRTRRKREGLSPGDCPAELEAMDTVLFRGHVSIRAPKNVVLVEEGAFYAIAKTPTVSACDAVIDKMSVFLLEEIDRDEDLGAKGKKLLEKHGWENGVFAPPEVSTAQLGTAGHSLVHGQDRPAPTPDRLVARLRRPPRRSAVARLAGRSPVSRSPGWPPPRPIPSTPTSSELARGPCGGAPGRRRGGRSSRGRGYWC
jgi:hypothetical protein